MYVCIMFNWLLLVNYIIKYLWINNYIIFKYYYIDNSDYSLN